MSDRSLQDSVGSEIQLHCTNEALFTVHSEVLFTLHSEVIDYLFLICHLIKITYLIHKLINVINYSPTKNATIIKFLNLEIAFVSFRRN